jgi:hypothetical protein
VPVPLSVPTPVDLVVQAVTLPLAALVAAAVLFGRPRRYPAAVSVLVVVLIFALALVVQRIDPVVVAALVGSAGVAAARLSLRRSRRL